MTKKQVVGLTGLARSGKSVASRHLAEVRGFTVVGASEIIRADLARTNPAPAYTREQLRTHGNLMKRAEGADFIIKRCIELPHEKIAIDGVRNFTAFQSLEAVEGIMIGLVAAAHVRYARELGAEDGKIVNADVAAMIRSEQSEMNSFDPNGLHILRILRAMPPDNIIDTSQASIPEVCERIDLILDGQFNKDKTI